MIYLASFYSGDGELVENFNMVENVTAKLLKENHVVFSPIVYNHEIAAKYKMPFDWDYWRYIDFEFIRAADELWVLDYKDWKKSVGVQAEIGFAHGQGKPISTVNPYTLHRSNFSPCDYARKAAQDLNVKTKTL